jgi:hypothetical protein
MLNSPATSTRRPDAHSARRQLEALYRRIQPDPSYCGRRHSLDEHLRLVALIPAFGGSLPELAAELQLPFTYIQTLHAYLQQHTAG